MKLDPALQSEASQKEKSKDSILTPMYGIGNNGTDEPIFQEGNLSILLLNPHR